MTATSSRIVAFADRWPKLVALLLGAVSATGFAPLHLWPLTLLALAGWMALVARSPKGSRALGVGWAFGVGHFVVGLNWIATAFTYQAAMPAWLGWIAVVHDENSNNKMDTAIFLPKEGFGFSRNPTITVGPPSFKSASFAVAGDMRQSIKMKYML